MLEGFHKGFAECGEQTREGNRSGVLGPRDAVHPHPELAGRGERDMNELDFEVFISFIILDRNSQVCFHKGMIAARLTKANRAQRCARVDA